MSTKLVSRFGNAAFMTAAVVATLLLGSACSKGRQQEYQTPASYTSQGAPSQAAQPYTYSQTDKGYYQRQQPAQSGTQYGERSGTQYGAQSNWQQYDSGAGSTYGSSSKLPTTPPPSGQVAMGQEGGTSQGVSKMPQQRQGEQGYRAQGQREQPSLQIEKARATLHGVRGYTGSGMIEFQQTGKVLKVKTDVQGLAPGTYNIVIANSALCPAGGMSQSDVSSNVPSQSNEPQAGGGQLGREHGTTAQQSGSQGQMHGQKNVTGQAGRQVSSTGQERLRLGQFRVGPTGVTQREWSTSRVSLKGTNSVLGRSVLIVSTGMRAQQGTKQAAGSKQSASLQRRILACGVIQSHGI